MSGGSGNHRSVVGSVSGIFISARPKQQVLKEPSEAEDAFPIHLINTIPQPPTFYFIAAISTYPKIDIQVPAPAELSIAHLKCDRHLVVFMQVLVEAFARMGFHLDIVGIRQSEQRNGCCY